jgi:hypothetical protein
MLNVIFYLSRTLALEKVECFHWANTSVRPYVVCWAGEPFPYVITLFSLEKVFEFSIYSLEKM